MGSLLFLDDLVRNASGDPGRGRRVGHAASVLPGSMPLAPRPRCRGPAE